MSVEPDEIRDRVLLVDYVEQMFRTKYALLAYKQARLGWSLDREIERLRKLARSTDVDLAGFRHALHLFSRLPADIHTGISFDSMRAVWLGISVRRTTAGYRVAWIDRSLLPESTSPVQLGDEVLRLGGADMDTVIAATTAETGWRSTPGYEQRIAEWFTVFRVEGEWARIPSPGDKLVLQVRRGGQIKDVELRWQNANAEAEIAPARRCPFWGKSRAGYLPDLGPIAWRNGGERVPAYVFSAGSKQLGYLRVHSYRARGADALATIAELDAAVNAFLERGVEAVVVDQLGNMGGDYGFGLTMLSRLSEEPLRPPTQRFITDARGGVVAFPHQGKYREVLRELDGVADARGVKDVFDKEPVLSGPLSFLPKDMTTVDDLRRFLRFVATPVPGGPRLTEPHFQVVASHRLEPSRGAPFKGRVLLLVDELNMSAAEYVAAAFLDNGRAKLFGATTSGAGGDQRRFAASRVCGAPDEDPTAQCVPEAVAKAMKRLGVESFALTVTLGLRVNRDGSILGPIENVGVAPTIPYAITAEDLAADFEPMRAEIVRALSP